MERPVALVVDRDPAVRAHAAQVLEEQGFEVVSTDSRPGATANAILALIEIDPADPTTLAWVERLESSTLVVGLADPAREAGASLPLRARLFEVLSKPIPHEQLRHLALVALDAAGDEGSRPRSRSYVSRLLGDGMAMRGLRSQLASVARGSESVWLVGERGTGRASAAALIHSSSARRGAAFVAIDCANARDVERLVADDGRLRRAEGGTLFLANLGDLRLDRQDDLEREVGRRVAKGVSESGIRVLVGLGSDPTRAVEEGRLLDDLRRAVGGTTLVLPPLRDRREDIGLLASSFLSEICEMNNLPPIRVSASALSVLEHYSWPGNAEELRGAIEQAVIVSDGEILRPAALPERIRDAGSGPSRPVIPAGVSARPFREAKRQVVEAFEKVYLGELLDQHHGNVTSAAQHAGMLRSALQRLLRKYRFKSADFRKTRRSARGAEGKSADDAR